MNQFYYNDLYRNKFLFFLFFLETRALFDINHEKVFRIIVFELRLMRQLQQFAFHFSGANSVIIRSLILLFLCLILTMKVEFPIFIIDPFS